MRRLWDERIEPKQQAASASLHRFTLHCRVWRRGHTSRRVAQRRQGCLEPDHHAPTRSHLAACGAALKSDP